MPNERFQEPVVVSLLWSDITFIIAQIHNEHFTILWKQMLKFDEKLKLVKILLKLHFCMCQW